MEPESDTGRNGRPDHHVVATAREVAERASAITRLELELAKLELKRKAGELGAGAGLAVGSGARAIVLTNQKGAVLELSGRQVGLMANADLSGLAITLK